MMATSFEYRFRYALYALIYVLGLWPTVAGVFHLPTGLGWLGLSAKSSWLILSAALARSGWLGFEAATSVLLVIAVVLTALGAWMRLWGAAYPGPASAGPGSVVLHGARVAADGPYRRTRNPLSLGWLLHLLGISLLMPPAGGVFAIAATWILLVRVTLAEESVLMERFGEAYQAYEAMVPRFLPAPKPMVPAEGRRPRWGRAVLGTSYLWGVVITLAGFGWDFNVLPLLKGILISLGVSLVLRALLPGSRSREDGGAPGTSAVLT